MIEILMAVYNGENYLNQQMESILKQSYTDWKLIIHDDGSSDRTPQIIAEYERQYPQKILVLEDGIKTGGAKYNFRHLLKHATAEYVMFADQDDVWEQNKIMFANEVMQKTEAEYKKETPILLHGDLQVVDSKLHVLNPSMFDMQKLDAKKLRFTDYLVQNNVTGCTMIMNQALRKKCLQMPDAAIMHDWWFALVASAFGMVGFMGDSGILYRQHGHNTEGAKNLKDVRYLMKKMFNGAEIRNTLELTYQQAQAFSKMYAEELSDENKEILNAYLSLKNMNKWKKLSTIKKYGFSKSGFVRQLGYRLYV